MKELQESVYAFFTVLYHTLHFIQVGNSSATIKP